MRKKVMRLVDFSLSKILIKNDFFTCIISFSKKIFDSIIYAMSIIVFSKFINSIIQILHKEIKIFNLLIWMALGTLIVGYKYISKDIDKLLCTILENKLKIRIGMKVLDKIANVSCENVTDKDLWEKISKYKNSLEKIITNIYMNFITLISSVLEFLIILIIIFKQNKSLAIIEFVLMVLMLVLSIFIFKLFNKINFNNELIEVSKLNDILKKDEFLNDREIFSYKELVNKKIEILLKKISKSELRLNLKKNIICKLGDILSFIFGIVSIIKLVPSIKDNKISIGFFIALNIILIMNIKEIFINAFKNISELNVANEIFRYLELIENLPLRGEGQAIDIEQIEFKNVSLKNAGEETYVFKNICFSLRKGKSYLFIGKNKAAIMFKLLFGMIDEFEGEILINGISLKEFSRDDLISSVSVFFKDFNKYPISIKENLNLGNSEEVNDVSLNKVMNKFNLCNFFISLPKGINTSLNDIDIEKDILQRFIISRLSLSETGLKIIEDFLETQKEKKIIDIYNNFNDINRDKIIVYISESNILKDVVDLVININNECINEAQGGE